MSAHTNRSTLRKGRDFRSGHVRALAILGVFAALAASGLIFFLINRVQTDSLNELRIQARKVGIPFSSADLAAHGYVPTQDASDKAYDALLKHLTNNRDCRAFFSTEVQKFYGFNQSVVDASSEKRNELVKPLLVWEDKLKPLIELANQVTAFEVWRPDPARYTADRDILTLSRLCQGLAGFAVARAASGDWETAERHLTTAIAIGRGFIGWPTETGNMIASMALQASFEGISALHRIGPVKVEQMTRLRELMERPLPRAPDRSRVMSRMAIQYADSFGPGAPLRAYARRTAMLSNNDVDQAEAAWLTQMINVVALMSPEAPMSAWILSLRNHSEPVDEASAKIFEVRAIHFSTSTLSKDPITGYFTLAAALLENAEERRLEFESSRRRFVRSIWGR